MSESRRELARAVVVCALGACLTLLSASRTWRVVGGGGLPDAEHSGTSLAPWLPAVALVGLAGAGALLAVRGRVRAALGAVLLASGVSLLAAGVFGAVTAGLRHAVWPLLAALGGALVCYAGLRALLRGASWPSMGSRYERPAAEPVEYVERGGPSRSDVAMWDALDRGEDPTRRGDDPTKPHG
ncbi:MAG: hypothetical protein AUI14_01255 [Actinobacteria bacterium 13_2_20CM_2_71_6]|nr:MAG: hypothetical protein AUI14_01255 [Actinobacteria bacterium 13_2_20CM_2_71_6]